MAAVKAMGELTPSETRLPTDASSPTAERPQVTIQIDQTEPLQPSEKVTGTVTLVVPSETDTRGKELRVTNY